MHTIRSWCDATEAILLAGGKGVGLEPITNTRPKPLVPILGSKLIERHLISLSRVGIKKVVVVVSYMGDVIKKFADEVAQKLGLDLVYVDQGLPLGTADAVMKAAPYVSVNDFVVLYADIYFRDADFLNNLIRCCGNVVTVAEVGDPSRYGVVVVSDGRVVKIVEKPKQYLSSYVNAGIYRFDGRLVRFLERTEPSERGEYELTTTMQLMIDAGIEFNYLVVDGWLDIGRPWSLLEANKLELSSLNKQLINGYVESGAVIKGPVIIGEGSQILSGSYIVGPSYIGRGVVVGPNAYIRPYTVVLDNSRVGFNVEVKESIIMENTHISHQSYVGDSVVCEGVNLGAGTILANLRFDEKTVKVRVKGVLEDSGRKKLGAFIGGYVRTGVNVSVFPGVKIGAYSWIYPGVVVTDDVPPKSILKHNGVLVSME
ncbi:MAG: sugar phosphate nucleotidyltransferase [Sulfolobales archaeon]